MSFKGKVIALMLLTMSLAACQTTTTTNSNDLMAGETGWMSFAEREQFSRQMRRNDLVPTKIQCRFTNEEFPKFQFKLWTKKVEGLSPNALRVFTEISHTGPYNESEKNRVTRVPSIDAAYHSRTMVWRGCMIPTPFEKYG